MFTNVNNYGQELLRIDNLSSLEFFSSLEAWWKSPAKNSRAAIHFQMFTCTAWLSSAWGSSSQPWKKDSWENNITLQILVEDVYNTLYVIR